MKNYTDSVCIWGYMTLCDKCSTNKPSQVGDEIKDIFPIVECEQCGLLAPNYKRLKNGKIVKENFEVQEFDDEKLY